jgi:DnaJ-class molecular chaperone
MRVAIGTTNPPGPPSALDLPLNNQVTIHLKVKAVPTFTHRDQHLYTTIRVPLSLLEKGGEYALKGPEGNLIMINIPAHTLSGTIVTVRKQGLRSGSSLKRGNLYCTLLTE